MKVIIEVPIACLVVTTLLTGCAMKKHSGDKGGDHVPENRVYNIDQLPDSSISLGLTPKASDSKYSQDFVRISESYHLCLGSNDFSDFEASRLRLEVTKSSDDINLSGLESVLNRALSTINRWSPSRKKFSCRIELLVFKQDEGRCDAVFVKSDLGQFPFSQDSFAKSDWTFFAERQLKATDGQVNTVPVIYFNRSMSESEQAVAFTRSTAKLLGLGYSSMDGSRLNPKIPGGTPRLTFHFEDSRGVTILDDDAAILYQFAAIYQDLLNPEDLGQAQLFVDRVLPGEPVMDSDLVLDMSTSNVTYKNIFDSRNLRGVRSIQNRVDVCFRNQSPSTIQEDWYARYLKFADTSTELSVNASIFFQMHKVDSTFQSKAVVASSNCQLLVIFRANSQFPFNRRPVAGLYAHEASISDASGTPSKIPLIYLNVSALELDPLLPLNPSMRRAEETLQHEFAHFLGFKHSRSSQSILSAIGDARTWDIAGSDTEMFKDYLRRRKQLR